MVEISQNIVAFSEYMNFKRAKIGHFLEMEFVGKVCCQVAGMYQNLKNVSSLYCPSVHTYYVVAYNNRVLKLQSYTPLTHCTGTTED